MGVIEFLAELDFAVYAMVALVIVLVRRYVKKYLK